MNIKNPIRTRLDINSWKALHTGMYLWSEGYLTDAEWAEIQSLDVDGYDSPAAVRLREMLTEKGYDGIVYPNGFEGDGDSYIAFSDEQIIKTEIRNTERGAGNADVARNDGGRYTDGYRASDGYNDGRQRAGIQAEGEENGGTIDSRRTDARGNGRNGEVSASTPADSIAEAYGATGVERSTIQTAYEFGRQNTPRKAVPLEGPAQEEAYNAGRIEYIRNMPKETSAGEKKGTETLTRRKWCRE